MMNFTTKKKNNDNNANNRNADKNSAKRSKLDSNSSSKNSHKKETSTNKDDEKNSSSTKTKDKKIFSDNGKKNHPQTPYRIAKFRDRIENLKKQKLSSVPDMDPAFFLRCHSDSNQPDDDGNLVWMCRFQPQPLSSKGEPRGTTNLMASCGGKIVCIIDYTSGKVMMRYKDINREENFYAMAWTTLEVSNCRKKGQKKPVGIIFYQYSCSWWRSSGDKAIASITTCRLCRHDRSQEGNKLSFVPPSKPDMAIQWF